MHLFIDTNVLLSFYHLTSDDLEELRKLSVLLKEKKVTLYATDQVVDEYLRNREVKISDAIKRLKEQKLNLQFPQMCKDYPEYALLRDLQKMYDEKHSALLAKLQADIAARKLKADSIIDELFSGATRLKSDPAVVGRAKYRSDIGNPPGKNGSLGDAVNWELLLEGVPEGQDLYFVTEDKDYASVLDESQFKEFLLKEWKDRKKSGLLYHKRLSTIFKDKFPDIKLASELEKDLLIKQFGSSPNFATTHATVAKLSKYTDFTGPQASEIVVSAISNNQIAWIIKDDDVHQFLKSIIKSHAANIEKDIVEAAIEMMEPAVVQDDDDNPPIF